MCFGASSLNIKCSKILYVHNWYFLILSESDDFVISHILWIYKKHAFLKLSEIQFIALNLSFIYKSENTLFLWRSSCQIGRPEIFATCYFHIFFGVTS